MSSAKPLTSTTAPGRVFASRAELAQHYQSDWHRYNLKRREAGLPVLLQADFEARWEAARALRLEQSNTSTTILNGDGVASVTGGAGGPRGRDHLKKKKNQNKHRSSPESANKADQHPQGAADAENTSGVVISSQAPAYQRIKLASAERQQQQEEGESLLRETEVEPTSTMEVEQGLPSSSQQENVENTQQEEIRENADTSNDLFASSSVTDEIPPHPDATTTVDIDPRQCLFDWHLSSSVQANVDRMHRKYGFFIPDQEYLVDVSGLIGYLHEKIKLGHVCLFCQKIFTTWQGCQKHMISKGHAKLRYEAGIDLDELVDFYDFSPADNEFLASTAASVARLGSDPALSNHEPNADLNNDDMNEAEDADDGDWEDVSDNEPDGDNPNDQDDDDMEDDEEDDDEFYAGYQQQVASMGFDVTPLGELVFPDGRIVGHRALKRYYKQRLPTHRQDHVAVQAARLAAGDRLYRGQVYNVSAMTQYRSGQREAHPSRDRNAIMLKQVGISPNTVSGRMGQGILVASGPDRLYSQLSVYRYRAAVRKQRRGNEAGRRLQHRSNMNMNRMDKKANRLMNDVSVRHALR